MPVVIAHVLGGLGHGGNESLCLQLIRHAPPGVDNVVIYQDPTRTDMLPQFKEVSRLKVLCVDASEQSRWGRVRSLARELRTVRPQAVLIYAFGVNHLLASTSARLAGIRSVRTRAGNPPPAQGSGQWKWRVIIALSRLLRVSIHACSQAVHRDLAGLTRLPAGSGPIPNGCDVEGIAERAARARRARNDNKTVIGMVARLDPIKDQATLVRAFATLAEVRPDVELWLIGQGEREEALRALAGETGVSGRVVFWGQRADVPELLGQMDVYAFSTTRDEGFGIALIEAMAAELPIVASDVPAGREVLGDGVAGLLVPPSDADAMAAALDGLMGSPEARVSWGRRAYERATAEYSIETCARRWHHVLLGSG